MNKINKRKKIIRFIVTFLVVLPMLNRAMTYEADINGYSKDIAAVTEEKTVKENEIIRDNEIKSTDPYNNLITASAGSIDLADQFTIKRAYLTFDDGPSTNTDKILDILNAYGVKGTFFVNNKTDEASIARYRRIVSEGHTIGLHSTSHVYSQVYASLDSFLNDYAANQAYVASVTGVVPVIYRFPGGSNNSVSPLDNGLYEQALNDLGIRYYDWNVSAGDAVRGGASRDKIIQNVFSRCDSLGNKDVMILMHDLKPKVTTVEALPYIIEGLIARGYVILPVDTGVASSTPTFHLE
ncbi:MAG: polysaccharide deacetylase [Lachnospiraceae bacterium]|nr:polysaccharide deacetylase [Lachnospiraceae bacterium]